MMVTRRDIILTGLVMDAKVKQYLAKFSSKGGKERAAKHDKAKLTEWAKLGGRPRKKEKKS